MLLPIYLGFLQISVPVILTLIYTLAVAGLMVSRLPVLSGKKTGMRVRPDMVPPVIVVVVLFIALLVSYPWHLLTAGTIIYLTCLPLGWFSYQRYRQADAAAAASVAAPAADDAALPPQTTQSGDERPARLT